MKVRLLIGLSLLLLLAACNGENLLQSRPSDVLISDQMILLLVDIHLADASLKLNQTVQEPSQINKYYSATYAPVFKKHNTTAAVFTNSINWYGRNIDELEEIYAEVITRLSTLESQIRITVRPNKAGKGEFNPFSPATDSAYLPEVPEALQIPYALPLK